jgi:hypothetical protein
MMLPRDHCIQCGALLTRHERFSGSICGNWRCRAAQLDEALRVHRKQSADVLGISDPEAFEPVVVPFGVRPIVALSNARRTDFLNFLVASIDEAFGDRELPPVPLLRDGGDAPTAGVIALAEAASAMVCGACLGVCCHDGGRYHAFLNAEAIASLRLARPDLTAEKMVITYVSHFPEEHFDGACVFQALTGCTLPRDLRAPICNSYQCRGLREAVGKLAKNPAGRLIVIAREDNRIIRSAFVDASGMRRYLVQC